MELAKTMHLLKPLNSNWRDLFFFSPKAHEKQKELSNCWSTSYWAGQNPNTSISERSFAENDHEPDKITSPDEVAGLVMDWPLQLIRRFFSNVRYHRTTSLETETLNESSFWHNVSPWIWDARDQFQCNVTSLLICRGHSKVHVLWTHEGCGLCGTRWYFLSIRIWYQMRSKNRNYLVVPQFSWPLYFVRGSWLINNLVVVDGKQWAIF